MSDRISNYQLRVTGAQPGKVTFELDIQKEHTVSLIPFLTALRVSLMFTRTD
jgi:hypothetical protein